MDVSSSRAVPNNSRIKKMRVEVGADVHPYTQTWVDIKHVSSSITIFVVARVLTHPKNSAVGTLAVLVGEQVNIPRQTYAMLYTHNLYISTRLDGFVAVL